LKHPKYEHRAGDKVTWYILAPALVMPDNYRLYWNYGSPKLDIVRCGAPIK